MRKISVGNPTVENTYSTGISTDYVDGTDIFVYSNVSFAANDFTVIGHPGEERTELKQISSLTDKDTISIASALNFSHIKDTPISKVNWDQVSIEGRSTSAGTFAELTQSAIQWDKLNTVYFHTAGTDTWQYRFRFYNSSTATYSEYSPTVLGSGFTRQMVGYMIREVRRVTNDLDGRVASDRQIIRFFNEAQDIIRGVRPDWWFLKVTDSSITSTGGDPTNALPANIGNTGNVETIRVRFADGTSDIIYQLRYLSATEFDELVRDQNQQDDDHTTHYTLEEADSSSASGYFRVFPTPETTGRLTFYIRYYREMADLDTVEDETLVPIPSLLENFAIGQIEKIKQNEDKAKVYDDLFYGPSQQMKRTRALSGIALLESLNNQKRIPIGQPRSLFRFRGQDAIGKYFGDRTLSRDDKHERYW